MAYCQIAAPNGKWKLPTKQELSATIDKHRIPTIKSNFKYSSIGCYWVNQNINAGYFDFEDGTYLDTITDINQKCFVRCIKK